MGAALFHQWLGVEQSVYCGVEANVVFASHAVETAHSMARTLIYGNSEHFGENASARCNHLIPEEKASPLCEARAAYVAEIEMPMRRRIEDLSGSDPDIRSFWLRHLSSRARMVENALQALHDPLAKSDRGGEASRSTLGQSLAGAVAMISAIAEAEGIDLEEAMMASAAAAHATAEGQYGPAIARSLAWQTRIPRRLLVPQTPPPGGAEPAHS